MVKKIVQIGDKKLLQRSVPLSKQEVLSRETRELIQSLLDTCNADKQGTGGLSAVQIGDLKRIYVVNRMDLPQNSPDNPIWEVLINPELTVLNDESSIAWEGCLSIGEGEQRLFGPVSRPDNIRVDYLDSTGKEKSIEATGYFAHVVQHEQDHLDGILFLKYVQNPLNIWKSIDLDQHIAETGEFPEIV